MDDPEDDAIGTIVSRLRHQLGNPINAVGCTLRLLASNLERFDQEQLEQYLGRALDELTHVQRLLDGLKSLGKNEVLTLDSIDVSTFVGRLERLVRADVPADGFTFTAEVTPEDLSCRADPMALQRALREVITNAFEACEEQPEATVSLEVEASDEGVLFRLTDTGGGLTNAALEQLFQPLWSSKRGHVGLGLFEAHRLVEAMGGTIDVRSDDGLTTVVDIVLPRESDGHSRS